MMRKKLSIVLIVFILVVTCIAAANQYTPYSNNQKTVYQYLRNQMGLNQAVSCGIMANLYYESKFNATLLGDHGTSYGICQWHNVRWKRMKSYCRKHNLDPESLEGQLKFMNYELKHNYKKSTYNKLLLLDNTQDSAYQAADIWCRYYERPAALEQQCAKRGKRAAKMFFDLYGGQYGGQAVLPVDRIQTLIKVTPSQQTLTTQQAYTLHIMIKDIDQSVLVNRLAVYYTYEVKVVVKLGGKALISKGYDHEDTIDLPLEPKTTGELKVSVTVTGDHKKIFKKTFKVDAS